MGDCRLVRPNYLLDYLFIYLFIYLFCGVQIRQTMAVTYFSHGSQRCSTGQYFHP